MSLISSLNFHICKTIADFRLKRNLSNDKVYLTFDDGPEPEITEFILDTLRKYNAKATFFCCGNNCAKHPELLSRIKKEGHAVANHTYSHLSGISTKDYAYELDVDNGYKITGSILFRPPWGGASISQYLKLSRKYYFVYWDVLSGNTEMDSFDLNKTKSRLISTNLKGKIILFHFCKLHENETRKVLPLFMEILKKHNYESDVIKVG